MLFLTLLKLLTLTSNSACYATSYAIPILPFYEQVEQASLIVYGEVKDFTASKKEISEFKGLDQNGVKKASFIVMKTFKGTSEKKLDFYFYRPARSPSDLEVAKKTVWPINKGSRRIYFFHDIDGLLVAEQYWGEEFYGDRRAEDGQIYKMLEAHKSGMPMEEVLKKYRSEELKGYLARKQK